MAGEHEGLTNERVHRVTRRKLDPWDRMKILVLLGLVIVAGVGSQVNPPFVTLNDAFAEFTATAFGAIVVTLFALEIVRQIHYAIAERAPGYHAFWADKFFGGIERGTQKRVKPWTRFRVARFVRWGIYITIYALLVSNMVDGIETPIEAITSAPVLLVGLITNPEFLRIILYMMFAVGQFVLIFWFLSRGGTDIVMPEEIKTRFSDVWGQDSVVRLLKENIAFLEKPDEIEAKGGYIPGGILLWGPPGTGKTLIAEAVAGETGRPYVFVDPGAFINMFFGVGILKVKSLYRKLRKLSLRHGGVIVFFDEADSLGSRGSLTGLGMPGMAQPSSPVAGFDCNGFGFLSPMAQQAVFSEMGINPVSAEAPRRTLVNRIIMGGMGGGGGMGTLQALLTEMNGLTKPRGIGNKVRKLLGMRPKLPPKYRILHIMATNMPNALDEAMLRPGRIDRIFKVGYPSKEGRKATLQGYLAKVSHSLTEEDVEKLSVVTPYYSGAKIKDLINEALIQAIRDGRDSIEWQDIWKAKALKELGPPADAEYIQRERHAVAIHEASHAVVAHLMRKHMAIDLVTIERHGDTGGMVKNLLAEDRFTQWKSEFETDIMVSLASLAGERMFFGDDNSSGVSGDLRSATAVAAYMEGVWGMGEQKISYAIGQTEMGQPGNPASTALRSRQDEISARLEDLYQRAWDLLDEHREKVLAIAAVLEERKTISGDDVTEIMGVAPGTRLAREPKGWQLVDETAAEERRVAALASITAVSNGSVEPEANGHQPDEPED